MFPYVYSSVYIYVYISSINNTFKKKKHLIVFHEQKKHSQTINTAQLCINSSGVLQFYP